MIYCRDLGDVIMGFDNSLDPNDITTFTAFTDYTTIYSYFILSSHSLGIQWKTLQRA